MDNETLSSDGSTITSDFTLKKRMAEYSRNKK